MTWHVDEQAAQRYVGRGLDATSASSIETHLVNCGECRARIGGAVDPELLSFVWSEISDALDQPHLGWVERGLRRFGCSDSTTRIVVATTRARYSYLIAVLLSLAVAVAASLSHRDSEFAAFLMLAPIGPLVATAGAFGSWADPAHPLLAAAPTPTLRIVLVRSAASVVPAIALTAMSTPILLDRGWMAMAWLLPSLALTIAALMLSTWFEVEIATALVGAIWLVLPILIQFPSRRLLDVFAGQIQLVSIGISAVGVLTMMLRRPTFDPWGGR